MISGFKGCGIVPQVMKQVLKKQLEKMTKET